MTKRFSVTSVALGVVALCVCLALVNAPQPLVTMGAAESVSMDEDADGRDNYEIMRLCDPATGKIPAGIRARELAFAENLPKDGPMPGMLARTTASGLAFQSRGPWNVGGRTRACAIDVSNENNLLAGTVSGGMWRSTDGGNTWATTTPINAYMNVSCITQDKRPGHRNTWYYGSGEGSGASASSSYAYYYGNGIFKSTDSGVTWNVLASTTSTILSGLDLWSDLIWNITTDSSNSAQDVVYAAAYGGIYRSTDGGTTWTLVKGSFGATTDCLYTDVAVTKAGIVYATLSSDGANRGIYRSSDGVTFINITPTGFAGAYNRLKIGICPDDETQVYILGNTPGYGTPDTNYVGSIEWNSLWKYKYLSGDGSGTGGRWIDRSSGLPNTGGSFDKFMTQGSYDMVIKVKPGDSNTVFLGGTNLYYSTAQFADTTHTRYIGGYEQRATLPIVRGYANHHPDQHELLFYPSNPNKMISTNDGGIFRTNNNAASPVVWSSLNNGYVSSMFYTCAIDHATTSDIVIGGAQDNGSWYTNTSSLTSPWVSPRGGDGSYCAIADNEAAYYFSIQGGKVMKGKLNASGGVDSFARIDPIGAANYLFINPFVLDPTNTNLMYLVSGGAFWRNNDLGGIPYLSNWDTISTNWTKFPDSLSGQRYSAIGVSAIPAHRVYLGTTQRKVYRYDNAHTGTPTKVDITSTTTNNTFPTNGYVSCVAVDPHDADNIIVSFSNYNVYSLFSSTNGGTTWTKIGGNLEPNSVGNGNGPSIRWAKIIPLPDGVAYLVATSVGLYGTTHLDSINTVWTQLGTSSIGSSVVDMIDYRANDGLTVIATHSHGIFSTHITQVADVDRVKYVNNNTPTFELSAYPNPFRISTNIRFTLATPDDVSMTIFDLNGRVITSSGFGVLPAGDHNFPFKTDLMPGMYFCTLQIGRNKATTKLVVNQ